jgi:PAS domain S-box-containing protein
MRNFLKGLLSFVIGAAVFSLLFKLIDSVPGREQLLLVMLVGGIGGLLFFKWSLKQERALKKLVHANRVLNAVRQVNRMLTRAKDRQSLIKGICDTLVDNRSYFSIWAALLDDDGNWETFAEAGLGQDFGAITSLLQSGVPIECGRKALVQPDVVVTDEPITLCGDCPLTTRYKDHGAISTRIEYDGKIYGLITLSVPKELIYDEDEKALVHEVAAEMAFGLRTFELEKERSIAEKDLQASEKRFRALVENSLTGISIIQNNEVVYQNREQERLLGTLPRSDILGDFENIHPDDVDKVRILSRDITSGHIQALDVEFRYAVRGNMEKPIWILCRANRIVFRKQEAILVNMMDLTDIKALENLLLVQEKMAALGRVTAGIAHEIRNPLSGINIYLNTLEKAFDRGRNQEKVKDIFRQVKSASGKIESVIRRVMDFSKPNEPNLIAASINAPVEEAIKLTAVTLRKSGIKLDKKLASGLPDCRLDPQLIEEVILNLINNAADAMRAMEEEKKITIVTAVENNHAVVRVVDSGPGIPSASLDKVFDPFFTTKPDSTGIGLSICHRIITDHKGTLRVQSGEQKGAEFVVSIPLM